MSENLHEIASQYFSYLAMTFPVMCASDEFYFFPRAEQAGTYYHRMENLKAEDLEEVIQELKNFRERISLCENQESELENRIDISLLQSNISGMLIELEKNRTWCHNPLLYLKIAFIGMDHSITKPLAEDEDFADRFYGRFNVIPLLLYNAMNNITSVPETYLRSSLAMIADGRKYVSEIRNAVAERVKQGICDVHLSVFENILGSLEIFEKFLGSVMKVPDHHFSLNSLETSMKEHFLNQRSLEEIYEIAVDEWFQIKDRLHELANQIDPDSSWQQLYQSFTPSNEKDLDILSLYKHEMRALKSFFHANYFPENMTDPAIDIIETPTYLRSVRGTASFGAALTADINDTSYFFITTRLPGQASAESDHLLTARLHKEYKFLTAHETIPGHHLLDSMRRNMKNPIRRQIESPLFYEGWASYAESLLCDLGYVQAPIECLVEYKRRLWRAARCQIDAGIPAGKLTYDDAAALLTQIGFSKDEARRQIDRFRLNPGYQLCYTLGTHEIRELKKKYSPYVGEERFYHMLLNGGQLPFCWIDKRLDAISG